MLLWKEIISINLNKWDHNYKCISKQHQDRFLLRLNLKLINIINRLLLSSNCKMKFKEWESIKQKEKMITYRLWMLSVSDIIQRSKNESMHWKLQKQKLQMILKEERITGELVYNKQMMIMKHKWEIWIVNTKKKRGT